MIKYSEEKTTYTKLGQLLGSSRQNVKNLALSLEKKGVITITIEPSNKRNTLIILTKKAHEYSEAVFDNHTDYLNNIFQDYSNDEIHLFYNMITKLYAGVERLEETFNE